MSNCENTTYRIYVACLAAYNAGFLHGKWIDLNQPLEAIYAEIHDMLAKSPMPDAEEWEIHDHDFGVCGYLDVETAKEIADFQFGSGEVGEALISHFCGNVDEAKKALEEYYQGEFDSELDYAEQLFDDCYLDQIPESLQSYIDYKSFAYDIFIDGYFSVKVGCNVHVFSTH
jgi:antirestriction protein